MNIINLKFRKGIALMAAVAIATLGFAPGASAAHTDVHISGAAAVVLESNGGAEIQAFTPDLGLDSSTAATLEAEASAEATAYYGVNVVVGTTSPDVHWEITVDHETEALASGDVTIEEVGTFNASGGQVRGTPATYSTTEAGGNLVLSGNTTGWSITSGANFTNVDEITFAADAPVGTYTITRALIDEGSDTILDEVFTFTITLEEAEVVVPPTGADVMITGSANGTVILNGDAGSPETLATYSPDADLNSSLDVVLEGSTTTETTVYYATESTISTTTSTELSDANIQWKIVVDHETESLTVGDVEINDMGYYFQVNGGAYSGLDRDTPFPYNPTMDSGMLVFTGDGSLSVSEGMVLTNVDEITFSADAPQGTYTITRILTVPSQSAELEESFSFTITLGEADGGGEGEGDGDGDGEEPINLVIVSPTFPFSTPTNPIVITGTATTSASLLTVTGGASTATSTIDAEGDWSLSVNLTADSENTLLLTLTDDEENVVATSSVVVTHATVVDGGDDDDDGSDNNGNTGNNGSSGGSSRSGGFARAALVTPLASTVPGNAFGLTMIQGNGFPPGQVLGAAIINDPVRMAQIMAIRAQLAQLIGQLITRLQAQLNLQLAGSGNVGGATVSAQ